MYLLEALYNGRATETTREKDGSAAYQEVGGQVTTTIWVYKKRGLDTIVARMECDTCTLGASGKWRIWLDGRMQRLERNKVFMTFPEAKEMAIQAQQAEIASAERKVERLKEGLVKIMEATEDTTELTNCIS